MKEIQANHLVVRPASTRLAPLQACARFCLESETFPVFLAWLRREVAPQYPAGFFDDAAGVRLDIGAAHDAIGDYEDILLALKRMP